MFPGRKTVERLAAVAALVFVFLKFVVPPTRDLPLRYFGVGFWAAATLAVALTIVVMSTPARPGDTGASPGAPYL